MKEVESSLLTSVIWGMRCRETLAAESIYNRRILKKRLEREAEIILGTFEYESTFKK